MSAREIQIDVGGGQVSAAVFGAGATVVALGHGAGGTRRTPSLIRMAEGLAASGRTLLLFNFPYSEAGRGVCPTGRRCWRPRSRPWRAPRARASEPSGWCWAAARWAGALRHRPWRRASPPTRSCSSRTRCIRPASPSSCATRICRIESPMLFVQGTRDAFARLDLLEKTLVSLGARATLERIEDGDHSFGVPKRLGRSAAQVEASVVQAVSTWLEARGL